ncbi:MAG: hypothetical protein J6L00_05075 [Clostridia bacterium]|nr:hypothetical protein [Clostridia bacterium]
MTAGELNDVLKELPRGLPVLLQVRRDVTVKNAVNDRIDGTLDAAFHIETVDLDEMFSLGKGWHTAIFLVADGEV